MTEPNASPHPTARITQRLIFRDGVRLGFLVSCDFFGAGLKAPWRQTNALVGSDNPLPPSEMREHGNALLEPFGFHVTHHGVSPTLHDARRIAPLNVPESVTGDTEGRDRWVRTALSDQPSAEISRFLPLVQALGRALEDLGCKVIVIEWERATVDKLKPEEASFLATAKIPDTFIHPAVPTQSATISNLGTEEAQAANLGRRLIKGEYVSKRELCALAEKFLSLTDRERTRLIRNAKDWTSNLVPVSRYVGKDGETFWAIAANSLAIDGYPLEVIGLHHKPGHATVADVVEIATLLGEDGWRMHRDPSYALPHRAEGWKDIQKRLNGEPAPEHPELVGGDDPFDFWWTELFAVNMSNSFPFGTQLTADIHTSVAELKTANGDITWKLKWRILGDDGLSVDFAGIKETPQGSTHERFDARAEFEAIRQRKSSPLRWVKG